MAIGLWRRGLLCVGGAIVFTASKPLVLHFLPSPHGALDYPVAIGLAFLISTLLTLVAAVFFSRPPQQKIVRERVVVVNAPKIKTRKLACSKCRSSDVRLSHSLRRSHLALNSLFWTIDFAPFRCRSCNQQFYRRRRGTEYIQPKTAVG